MSFFELLKESNDTNARISTINLQRRSVILPIFMPVATHGVLKASHFRVKDVVLGNTFHLRDLNKDLKDYMGIDACLTDSGGFQIISLKNTINEDGVLFLDYSSDGKLQKEEFSVPEQQEEDIADENFSNFCRNVYCFDCYCEGCPFEEMMREKYLKKYENRVKKIDELYNMYILTPEKSISIQNKLNSDIAMQLDDVIRPESNKRRHLMAVKRSIRWLDRLLHAHKNKTQNIFPIVQGGLHEDLRNFSVEEILKRTKHENVNGIAIGGLCGGESKKLFCEIVFKTSKILRSKFNGPIYVMGVGYPEDVIISICLGSDMSDCVYPTRTARFGRIFTDYGDINLNSYKKEKNTNLNIKINDGKSLNDCKCRTCKNFTLEYLVEIRKTENFCILTTEHNLFYMQNLTDKIKLAIQNDNLLEFLKEWTDKRFGKEKPDWILHVFELLSIKQLNTT
ncbi:tRNA-guanine transglycosylase [Pseudoloma neurophilia]|uniref:tRNA-guanine transglycosylase n=1 Tax=Pseudoloma neurophilia TaxID=146866 RepID=A0A0R0M3E9_9MICR|nr:tRNA-guanine transglycosylase [Pseudoloma neurophilia]